MKFICIVPHYWGIGDTIAEAKKNCRKAGGRLNGPRTIVVTEANTAYVHEEDVSVVYPRGTEMRIIEQRGQKSSTNGMTRLTPSRARIRPA